MDEGVGFLASLPMNELVFFINRGLISGLIIGSVYALGAVGVTLIFGILRFAHFAHGDMMTVGAFVALVCVALFPTAGSALGLPSAFVLMPVAMAVTAILAIGLDRTFLALLSNAYTEEKLDDGSERVVMKLPPVLAPIKAAVLPLVAKDGLPEKARQIMDTLKYDYNCQYEEKDSIGKRYRRQDAIGTPYCITVDHQTLEDNTVTIRERDTMLQERVDLGNVSDIIAKKLMVN